MLLLLLVLACVQLLNAFEEGVLWDLLALVASTIMDRESHLDNLRGGTRARQDRTEQSRVIHEGASAT